MRSIFRNSAGFVLALVFTLILVELFVYNAGIARRSEVEFKAEEGKVYKPNYKYTWFSEGYSMGVVNKGGYLGPFYSMVKPKKVKRIAILGDSYIEGIQVFERNHLRSVLEKRLNQMSQDSVQVLNFGRSNFNFPNMVAYAKMKAQNYKPDLIVYFVSTEDLTSLTTDFLLPNIEEQTLNALPFLNDQSASSFVAANRLLSKSAMLYMANTARHKFKSNGLLDVVFDGKLKFNFPAKRHHVELQPLSRSLLQNMGAPDVVLVYREKAPLDDGVKKEIIDLGVNLIDLSAFLNELEKSGQNPNAWFNQKTDGHWNVQGHKAVANYLVEVLQIP